MQTLEVACYCPVRSGQSAGFMNRVISRYSWQIDARQDRAVPVAEFARLFSVCGTGEIITAQDPHRSSLMRNSG